MFETDSYTVNGEASNSMPQSAGIFDISVTTTQGRPARFTLSLPDSAAGPDPVPLFLILHYGGQPTPFYGRPLIEMLFGPAWKALGGIFVAPETVDGQWHTEANEAFVMQLMQVISDTYPVDPARVVVGGYSMGAIGSWHYITHYPERFSAAVPVAGFPSGPLNCMVPVYTMATESDEIFDYRTFSERVDELRKNDCDVTFETVAARGHYDVGGFVDALRATTPWLESKWDTSP